MVLKIQPSRRRKRLRDKSSRKFSSSIKILTLISPLLLWFSYKQIRSCETPQAVLMLGGSTSALEREKFTAKFVSQQPNLENLEIWISSGGSGKYNNYAREIFIKAGINSEKIHFDNQAVDTVTNFTTLVDELKARGVTSVYLITSDYHIRRAQVIGEVVLGSRGIVFKSVAVPSQQSPEPIEKAIRDGARAILWVITGNTGKNFSRYFSH
ncbi:YdcF family protein [Aerosakkonemataceae cyanobacterium BLCC-F167]|uniref:YdcF family protein n=1 Tax=Floridaenema evergladense BLCC-F167 TaxID=3153639 RepID=A0ABV4WHV1_9CYAN